MNNDDLVPVPKWMQDADMTAPCMCGNPKDPHIPNIMMIDENTGLRRWWHYPCWTEWMADNYEDYEEDT